MFENELKSLSDFSEDEIEALLKVLTGQMTWDEFYEDEDEVTGEQYAPPAWLLELTGRLDVAFLYSVEYEHDPGSFSLGWIHDETSGDYWMFSTCSGGECLGERLAPGASSLTPAELWPLVEADLGDTGDACLYGTLWCHPDLVPEDEIQRYLENLMVSEGLDRLEGGEGPTLEEWLMRNYHGKEKQS